MGALAALALGSLASSLPAGASVLTQTLPTNHIRGADLPLPGAVVPADGRLRGQHFTATVTEAAWPGSVTVGKLPTVAPTGDRLVAFTLRLSEPGALLGALNRSTAVRATLTVTGDHLPLPLTGTASKIDEQIESHSVGEEPGTGTESFAVSVPVKDHQVILELRQGSFSQAFDLWTLKREPPAPTILYRDPAASMVAASVRGSGQLTITNPATGFVTEAKVSIRTATLGYFAPDGTGANPAKPTEAFLSVTMQATQTEAAHSYEDYLGGSAMPGSQLTFTPTGGLPVPSTRFVPQTTDVSGANDGLLAADYWFTVPAGVTSGTLTINAGQVTGTQYQTLASTGTVPLTLTKTTLPITFPDPPAAPPAQNTPPWVGKPVPTATVSAAGSTSGHGFSIWLAVVVIVVVAALAVVTERLVRRRRLAGTSADTNDTTAVVWSPPRDPPSSGEPRTATALADIPPANQVSVEPRLGAPGDLVVRILGPVQITGWVATPERRGVLEELCCYLALHPGRGFTTAELLGAVWPVGGDRGEATPKTLHNYLSRLRRAVGAERLPDAVTSGGYRLDGVVTDWAEFRRLDAEAETVSHDEADRLRSEALALVRGAPLADASGVQYGWAFTESLASTMTVAVRDCAHRLSVDRLAGDDPVGAEEAARMGLRATVEDEDLWLDAARAAQASGDRTRQTRVWRDLAAALGGDRARVLRQGLSDEPAH
jgi:hypothetical protein